MQLSRELTNHCKSLANPQHPVSCETSELSLAPCQTVSPPQSETTGDGVWWVDVVCVCFRNTFRGILWTEMNKNSVCLLSHRWLRAIRSECVSVVFLLRWEFHSFPRDGQCDFFTWDLWIGRELLWNKLNIFPEQSIFDAVLVSWSAEAWFSYGPRDTGHVEAFLFQ